MREAIRFDFIVYLMFDDSEKSLSDILFKECLFINLMSLIIKWR